MSRRLTEHKLWCVAASVANTGLGTRHFAPGSNVYCYPLATDHGIIKVVGIHRVTHRYLTVFVSADQLTDWQVEQIDQPLLIKELASEWDDTDDSRIRAEQLAQRLRARYN